MRRHSSQGSSEKEEEWCTISCPVRHETTSPGLLPYIFTAKQLRSLRTCNNVAYESRLLRPLRSSLGSSLTGASKIPQRRLHNAARSVTRSLEARQDTSTQRTNIDINMGSITESSRFAASTRKRRPVEAQHRWNLLSKSIVTPSSALHNFEWLSVNACSRLQRQQTVPR